MAYYFCLFILDGRWGNFGSSFPDHSFALHNTNPDVVKRRTHSGHIQPAAGVSDEGFRTCKHRLTVIQEYSYPHLQHIMMTGTILAIIFQFPLRSTAAEVILKFPTLILTVKSKAARAVTAVRSGAEPRMRSRTPPSATGSKCRMIRAYDSPQPTSFELSSRAWSPAVLTRLVVILDHHYYQSWHAEGSPQC